MPSDELQLTVSFRKLLIGLLLTVVPVSLIGLFTLTSSDRALRTTIGTYFKTIATTAAVQVSQVVHDRVTDVGSLAVSRTILEAAAEANRAGATLSVEAFRNKVAQIEKTWNTPASEALVKEILANPASRLLRRRREMDPRFLRITVTDQRGATIAATHKTVDYYQADEDYWQAIYAGGRGAINVTDILYDEVTKSNYIGIGIPILEEGSNRFIGTVDTLVELSSMFPLSRQPQLGLGTTARTMLVKDDGTIIAAPNVTLGMDVKSDEFGAVRDAFRTQRGIQTGYVLATLPGGTDTLIGFADTGLRQDYRNLGWLVLVAQDASEAFAPVRGVIRMIWFFVFVGITGVTLLAMYFALHRRQRMTAIGAQAHPPHGSGTPPAAGGK